MKKMMMGFAGALSLLAAQSAAEAAEALQTFDLDEIVVVAHRDTDTAETSVNVKELIDAGQIKTAADILANVPGVVVTKGQNNGIQVGLRGLNHERTVIAINGNVVTNIGEIAMGRAMEWDALPVTGIKKIELIRGTSARYGGAVGGVINIITDDADVPGSKTTLRQSVGSWRTHKTTLIHQGTSADQRLSYNLNASYAKSGGYYRNNDSNGHNLHFDVTYKLNDADHLNLSYSHIYNREGIILANNRTKNPAAEYLGYDSAYPVTPNAQNWGDGYRQWKTDNIALQYTTPTTSLGLFDYRQTRHDEVRRVIKPMGKLRLLGWAPYWDSRLRNYGLNFQQTARAGAHTLRYGLQYGKMVYEIRTEDSRYELPSTGVFVEDDWALTDRTTLGLSLRYDHNKFEANSGALRDKTFTQLSPGLKITQTLSDRQTLHLSARRLFRSPTVADFSRWSTGYIDRIGSYQAAFAPGLSHAAWQSLLGVPSPEKGMNYELGWRAKLDDKTTVGVTGFYYDIDDFLNIQFKGGLLPPIVYNVGNVKVKGVEFTGEHRFNPHWALSAGYTRQSTTKSGDRFNAPLNGMPESTFNTGLRWDNLHGWQAALELRYFGAIPDASDSDYVSPYMVTDLTVSYSVGAHVINFAVNNLFDRYYEQTRDFRQPGINYNLSYQYTF
ncbi:MAG: TonB-dependent receptor [Schwartzia sp. (in: firmicutes)]